MTRPRVPDDRRQRTARACDSCKRRKQKCNGLQPCNTCIKKSLKCEYIEGRVFGKSAPTATSLTDHKSSIDLPSTDRLVVDPPPPSDTSASPTKRDQPANFSSRDLAHDEKSAVYNNDASSNSDSDRASPKSVNSETDEEIEVIGQIRLLQDPMKRLLYIGDSSSLSYLQLIRMIVYNSIGSTAFTEDPSRHHILEPVGEVPPTSIIPYILPDRDTAIVLVQSYFLNTQGVIELFDRTEFKEFLEACYSNPLAVDSSTLCLVYLVLAIGLVLATPTPNSQQELIIKRIRDEPTDRAESLFRAAKCLTDPLNGIENADLWIIQAWTLMTVYMLAMSKRNASYAYCGMAIRCAYSLGLHRIRETMVQFPNEKLRRNIWRSLFILDRFLAASLGRPGAISEEDCSDDALEPPKLATDNLVQAAEEKFRSCSLDSSVISSRSIGRVLAKVYLQRTISTRLAQEIVDECQLWAIRTHPSLDAERLFNGKAASDVGVAILHAYLLHYHSIILLTRPFFIDLLVKTRPTSSDKREPCHRTFAKQDKLSQACVAASTRSVALIQAAYEAKYLPQRNPFILYFLFSAALIILSNEFAGLYDNQHYANTMASTIAVIEYCSLRDIQASRMLYILKSFSADVEKHAMSMSKAPAKRRRSNMLKAKTSDPMEILQSRRHSLAGGNSTRGERESHEGTLSADLMQYNFDDNEIPQSAGRIKPPGQPPGQPSLTRGDNMKEPTVHQRASMKTRPLLAKPDVVEPTTSKTESFAAKREFGFGGLRNLKPKTNLDAANMGQDITP